MSNVSIQLKVDNSAEVINHMETAVHRALEACGIQAEAHAVTYIQSNPRRVDTGNLMNSIAHQVEGKTMAVGTNVEYGIYVHEGTTRMAPNRFLKNAVANHAEEYKMIIENELKKG